MKKISSIIENARILFEFEGYIIKEFDHIYVWMENSEGEGTTIDKLALKTDLRNIFNKNF